MARVNLVNFTVVGVVSPNPSDAQMGEVELPRIPDWVETEPRALIEREAIRGVREEARVLAGLVELFRRHYPDEWEQLRLCPFQHGLETMGEKLRWYRPAPPA